MKNTPSHKIHKKLVEIIAEAKRLEKTDTNSLAYELVIKQADRLRREYRKLNGFEYNPLFYAEGER